MPPVDDSFRSLACIPSHCRAIPPFLHSCNSPWLITTDSQPSFRVWKPSRKFENKLSLPPVERLWGETEPSKGWCPVRKGDLERRKGNDSGSMGEIDPNLEREKEGWSWWRYTTRWRHGLHDKPHLWTSHVLVLLREFSGWCMKLRSPGLDP